MKCDLPSYLLCLLETFLFLFNKYEYLASYVQYERRNACPSLHVKCLLFVSYFNPKLESTNIF
jgi:hypothetical protein